VDVMLHGTPHPVPGLRRKAVFAALALQPGQILSADRLIDIVWGDAAPATAANTLQSHVSQLRRMLGRGALVARAPGYLLDLGGQATDVQTAERLIGEGARAVDPGYGVTLLRSAVALWRGQPLVDLAGLAWFEDHARRLELLLLQARQALIDASLAVGEHSALVPELEALARQYPLHEQIHGQLMLALYRCGRQTDALGVYHRLRQTLDDDLAMRPGQALRDLEAAILRQDPALALPAVPVAAAPPPVVPAQLPPTLRAFTGRGQELARLDALLAQATSTHPDRSAAVLITAVSGTAGVGKTTLAVHWAHRVADRFPDGQLYVNLRGFDPAGVVLDPATAVRGFLDALGVPPERIPPDLDAQAALYRSLTAGKRMLVVLDNARNDEQVRPLLPGSAGCLVVVTSRNQLTGLFATDAAYSLTLDVLSAVEAHEFLAGRLGIDVVAAAPLAVERIIAACARLPLALAVAAARAQQTGFPLAILATELDNAGGRLDALDVGDTTTRVRAVFSWSYAALTSPAARLFRLLGSHPGPDISAPATASLAGQPPPEVRPLLAELLHASLLTEHDPGRYTFHDLLRDYAIDLTHTHDSDHTRHVAMTRLLDHYTHTAGTADRLLDPTRDPIPLPLARPAPNTDPERPADHQEAMDWLTTERRALLATLRQAGNAGFDIHAWQLAWALDRFLDRRAQWPDLIAAWRAALHAGRRLADPVAQAVAHRRLGCADTMLSRYAEAHTHLAHALDLFTEVGNRTGLVYTHRDRSILWERQGQPHKALDDAEQALTLSLATSNHRGQAYALNAVGWCRAQLGDHAQALTYCGQALNLHQQLGNREGQAATWDSLGYAHHHLGHYSQAVDCYQQALTLHRDLGYRYYGARTLARLGDTHHAAGNPTAAHITWQDALSILRDLHHPDADLIRSKLRRFTWSLPHPAPMPHLASQSGPVWSTHDR
jgi:DNA-binding SARP family transcriptional activator